jgi:hypothetical protein
MEDQLRERLHKQPLKRLFIRFSHLQRRVLTDVKVQFPSFQATSAYLPDWALAAIDHADKWTRSIPSVLVSIVSRLIRSHLPRV